jgi:hypothetical protein
LFFLQFQTTLFQVNSLVILSMVVGYPCGDGLSPLFWQVDASQEISKLIQDGCLFDGKRFWLFW